MKLRKIALMATVMAVAPLPGMADGEKVGERVETPIGTVKVDTNGRGDVTVRPDTPVGPSVTVGGDAPTPANPKGGVRGSVGVTVEIP